MVIDKGIERELIGIVKRLKRGEINFSVVGSVALYLQGMDVSPHDIDIITDKKNFDKIFKIYGAMIKGKVYSGEEELKDSIYFCHFFEFRINSVKVEIMADTYAKNKKTGRVHRSDLKLKKFVKHKGLNVPVMSVEEELKAKEVIAWKSKRINRIKKFLETKG